MLINKYDIDIVFINSIISNMFKDINTSTNIYYIPVHKSFISFVTHELNKTDVYRSDALCDHYTKILEDLGLQDIKGTGIYPVPMISNSPEFPFTLLNEAAELNIVKHFERLLEIRGGTNPWLCDESFGQAILVTARK